MSVALDDSTRLEDHRPPRRQRRLLLSLCFHRFLRESCSDSPLFGRVCPYTRWIRHGASRQSERSEIELIDILLVEYLGWSEKDLAPVDDLYLSKFAGIELGCAWFKSSIDRSTHCVSRQIAKVNRVPENDIFYGAVLHKWLHLVRRRQTDDSNFSD